MYSLTSCLPPVSQPPPLCYIKDPPTQGRVVAMVSNLKTYDVASPGPHYNPPE